MKPNKTIEEEPKQTSVEGVKIFSNTIFHAEYISASVVTNLHVCMDEDEEHKGMAITWKNVMMIFI